MTGFKIGEKHTYTDWGLRCYDYKITVPEKQKNLIQVPGRNGKIDVSLPEQRQAYGHRKIEIYCDAPDRNYEQWTALTSKIANYLQDEYLSVTPDFDSAYHYTGWATVAVSKDWKEGSDIIFTVDAEPFKLKNVPTTKQVIATAEGTQATLVNSKKKVNPKIITTGAVTIEIGDNSYAYNAGTYARAGFYLPQGSTDITVTGDATVTFEYTEGKI